MAALSSTIMLKIGQVQYLEIVNIGVIVAVLRGFARQGYQGTWFRPYLRLACMYAAFVVAALALAVASLRYNFYLPDDLSVLKYPVVISIARAVELIGNVSMMLYLANLFRKETYWLTYMMRVYFWVGVASAVFSWISYPIHLAGIASLGVYSNAHRFRGFYNEGGPYGVYIISVLVVGLALDRSGWERRGRILAGSGFLAITMVMAQSKAAYGALLVLGMTNVFLAGSFTRKISMLAAGALTAIVVLALTPTAQLIVAYRTAGEVYERASHVRSKDLNFVYGRIAGAFIVPRMIAAHPLTGIGWGNYGNVRNDPQYRGASFYVPQSDDPGLGMLGTAADLGLPLTAYLLVCLSAPFFQARRRRVPLYVVNLALWEPVVHLLGAQLNSTFPWITTAFALGLIYSRQTERTALRPAIAVVEGRDRDVRESGLGGLEC